jgi:hypothetical protein
MNRPADTPRSLDLRNRIASARAWGDVAARDALHHGAPMKGTVETVIGYWQEILDEITKED